MRMPQINDYTYLESLRMLRNCDYDYTNSIWTQKARYLVMSYETYHLHNSAMW